MHQMAWDLTEASVRAIGTLSGGYARLQLVIILFSSTLRFVSGSCSINQSLNPFSAPQFFLFIKTPASCDVPLRLSDYWSKQAALHSVSARYCHTPCLSTYPSYSVFVHPRVI